MPKDIKAQLTNWFVLDTLDGGIRLVGKVSNNPKFPDGSVISTSPVVRVTTETGSEYTLIGESQKRVL